MCLDLVHDTQQLRPEAGTFLLLVSNLVGILEQRDRGSRPHDHLKPTPLLLEVPLGSSSGFVQGVASIAGGEPKITHDTLLDISRRNSTRTSPFVKVSSLDEFVKTSKCQFSRV